MSIRDAWAAKWLSAHRGAVAGALLLALALWEVGILVHAHHAEPADSHWRRAAAAVATARESGDLIVFAPDWADPLARMYAGDMMTVDQAARMDAARYGRIWELSIRGARSPETRDLGPAVYDETFGQVRVRRWQRRAPVVTWDLRATAKLLEVDFTPRLCVPINIERRQPGVLDAGTVRLGRQLSVYAGLSDFRSRKENRSYADLRVYVDDRDVTRAVVGNESGWLRLPPATLTPGDHHVVFVASVDPDRGKKDPSHLSLCVMAESYDE